MRRLLVAIAGLLLSCNDECTEVRCATVDRGPRDGDAVIELDTQTASVFYEIDDFGSDVGLTGGQIAFTTDDPSCVAGPDHPCFITLERLRLELSSMKQPTNEGDIELERPVLSVVAPLELVDEGFGFVVEPGKAKVQTCVSVDGRSDATVVPLETPLTMNLDFVNRSSSLEGQLPVRFGMGKHECVLQAATATVTASGVSPWAEGP